VVFLRVFQWSFSCTIHCSCKPNGSQCLKPSGSQCFAHWLPLELHWRPLGLHRFPVGLKVRSSFHIKFSQEYFLGYPVVTSYRSTPSAFHFSSPNPLCWAEEWSIGALVHKSDWGWWVQFLDLYACNLGQITWLDFYVFWMRHKNHDFVWVSILGLLKDPRPGL
jgi:hypothetical protein